MFHGWLGVFVYRSGKVVSGRGEAIALFAGRSELSDYFGAEPQPGTLNVVLDWPIQFEPDRAVIRLDDIHRRFWPATVDGHRCLVHRWPDCPLHVAELISPHRFRMEKSERIRVSVDIADTKPISRGRLLGWIWLWLPARKRAYSDDAYFDWANRKAASSPDYFGQQAYR